MSRFMIIDNNILSSCMLLAKMRLAGHEVESIPGSGGNEPIITMTRTTRPDAIIIDPTPAGSDQGFSLVSDLKAHPETKGIIIIAYSDSPDLALRERSLGIGAATHYDRTALDAEALISRLEKIIINKQKYEA